MAEGAPLLDGDYSFSGYDDGNESCSSGSCIEDRSLAGPINVAILSFFGLVGNVSIIYLVIRHKKKLGQFKARKKPERHLFVAATLHS